MGTKGRPKPARLAEKLRGIRTKLELSQNGMIRRMGLQDQLVQAEISAYELGLREPPLHILLAYARTANVLVEWLIDDEIRLPDDLPLSALPEWVRPNRVSHQRRSRKR
jgi:transcriptional regulator with XRE-family HTH domain